VGVRALNGPKRRFARTVQLAPGQTKLSDAQKRQLYHDGFLIIKGALPKANTAGARCRPPVYTTKGLILLVD
jgi:hypothetical protein